MKTDKETIRPLCSIFTSPRFIDESTAWLEHIPAAFCLAEVLKPAVFVELGTHYGASYFAFCQAISELGLPTRSFAVDTWQGDDHSGFYGNEVFDYVNRINSEEFGTFSTLLKMSFDQANEHFKNATIDLLHIDGFHSYESVRHDFDAWLPRMSDQGVVILHDTRVHHPGFGVWRLMDELKERYPSAEFTNGHGLGVVCTGKNVPDGFRDFLYRLNNDRFTSLLFHSLGNRVELKRENLALKKGLSDREIGPAKLYYSLPGTEFNESQSIVRPLSNDHFRFRFPGPVQVGRLRLDPANKCVYLRIAGLRFYIHGKEVNVPWQLTSNSAFARGDMFIFDTDEPRIYIDFPDQGLAEMDEVVVHPDFIATGISVLHHLHGERQHQMEALKDHTRGMEHALAHERQLAGEQATRIAVLEQQNEALKQLGRVQETTIDQNGKRIIELRQQLTARQTEIADLQRTVIDTRSSAEEKERMIAGFEDKVISLGTTLGNQFRELADLSCKLGILDAEISGIRRGMVYRISAGIKMSARPVSTIRYLMKSRRMKSEVSLVMQSGLFDEAFYLAGNPDVRNSNMKAIEHYLLHGGNEGRDPSPGFSSAAYLEKHPGIRRSGMNPLVHYLRNDRKAAIR